MVEIRFPFLYNKLHIEEAKSDKNLAILKSEHSLKSVLSSLLNPHDSD